MPTQTRLVSVREVNEAKEKVLAFVEWCRSPEGEEVRKKLEEWDNEGGVLTILCDMVKADLKVDTRFYPWNYLEGDFSLNSLLTKCCQLLDQSLTLPEGWYREFIQERAQMC